MPDLPGCMSDGGTRAEALANVEEAIAAWIYTPARWGEQSLSPDCTAPPDGRDQTLEEVGQQFSVTANASGRNLHRARFFLSIFIEMTAPRCSSIMFR